MTARLLVTEPESSILPTSGPCIVVAGSEEDGLLTSSLFCTPLVGLVASPGLPSEVIEDGQEPNDFTLLVEVGILIVDGDHSVPSEAIKRPPRGRVVVEKESVPLARCCLKMAFTIAGLMGELLRRSTPVLEESCSNRT